MATISKLLLRYQHALAIWAIPCLAAIAVLGWLAVVRVVRAPEIPLGTFRAYVLATAVIVILGSAVLLFRQ